MQRVCIIC